SGKMLIASSNRIVGAMKIHATMRSERPRTRLAKLSGVARAAASAARSSIDEVVSVTTGFPLGTSCICSILRPAPFKAQGGPGRTSGLHLAVVFVDFGPVGDEAVEGFLRGALTGDDIIVEALLRGLQQRGVARLGPEVLHDRHRVQEGLRIGL